jgi:hypothetical protein
VTTVANALADSFVAAAAARANRAGAGRRS